MLSGPIKFIAVNGSTCLATALPFFQASLHLTRAEEMISWIEEECTDMKKRGDLAIDLPPNFFPYIKPEDPDWLPRYALYNNPGEYHNGGIWPFVCGFYVAALVAAKKYTLAQ